MSTKRKLISIITPCYNEEETVTECHETVRKLFAERLPDYDREHIFCDNCSTDGTVNILRQIAAGDPHVKVIVYSRNFGGFRSLFNGLMSCSGDAVVVFLPADLQDPPEIIEQFVSIWEQGYEIAYGIRAKREESFLMRNIRRSYYRTVSRLANIEIPIDVGEFQLVDRKVVEVLRNCDDYYPYVRGMIAGCGFRKKGVSYTWKARQRGFSKNRLWDLLDQGLNGLISSTNIPLRICMLFGFTVSALSICFGFVAFVLNLIYYRQMAPPGIPTLIVALFFFSGLQLFFFGFLGEYIGAIHFQVRKRPLVVERERINFVEPGLPNEVIT